MGTINIKINPIIEGVYIVLENKDTGDFETVVTDVAGEYSFINLIDGNYSVYNVGIAPTELPPVNCGFPQDYSGTSTVRRADFIVTATSARTQAFEYDKGIPWSTLNGGKPPAFGITTLGGVDLVTGDDVTIPRISNNGMGYCTKDDFIYGSSGRSGTDGNQTLRYPFSYQTNVLIGDCDDNGYFYSPASGAAFTCINVNSYSSGYLRAANPYNNFEEIVSAPFSTSYTSGASLSSADWAYVPDMKSLVGVSGSNMFILSLTTPRSYSIPVIGIPVNHTGIAFSDKTSFYEPSGREIKRFIITPTVAIGSVFSQSTFGIVGDGCRAVTASLFGAEPVIYKMVDKGLAEVGDTLIYTITIVNNGEGDGTNAILQDTVPTGLEFIDDSIIFNGESRPNETLDNFSIGSLPAGVVYTLTFQGKITSTTLTNYQNFADINVDYVEGIGTETIIERATSNIVVTTVAYDVTNITKEVNREGIMQGDEIEYTLVVSNDGNFDLENTVVFDTIPETTVFIENTVTVDGISVSGANPQSGIDIGTLLIDEEKVIKFKVRGEAREGTIENKAEIKYDFGDIFFNKRKESNPVYTEYIFVEVVRRKIVDKLYTDYDENLLYTIVLENKSNVDLENLLFRDTIPEGTMFVNNSMKVDGEGVNGNPEDGINLGLFVVNQVITINFSVRVNENPRG